VDPCLLIMLICAFRRFSWSHPMFTGCSNNTPRLEFEPSPALLPSWRFWQQQQHSFHLAPAGKKPDCCCLRSPFGYYRIHERHRAPGDNGCQSNRQRTTHSRGRYDNTGEITRLGVGPTRRCNNSLWRRSAFVAPALNRRSARFGLPSTL